MKILGAIAKALTAVIVAGYGLFTVAAMSGSPGGSGVTRDEWVAIVVQSLVAGFAVWVVPNVVQPKPAAPPVDPAAIDEGIGAVDAPIEVLPPEGG